MRELSRAAEALQAVGGRQEHKGRRLTAADGLLSEAPGCENTHLKNSHLEMGNSRA